MKAKAKAAARFEPDDPWDRVTLGTVVIPTICAVKMQRSKGYKPSGRFDITMDVYERNWDVVQDFINGLDPMRAKPYPVEHPVFQLCAVRQVRIEEIESAHPAEDVLGTPIKVITIRVVEA